MESARGASVEVEVECLVRAGDGYVPADRDSVEALKDGIHYLYTLLTREYSRGGNLKLIAEEGKLRIEIEGDEDWSLDAIRAAIYRMEEVGRIEILEEVERV